MVPRGVEPPAPPPQATAPVVRPPAGVEPGLPRDEARNRVALLVPLSGANAGVGRSIANATMLALLDTQAKSVRITNYDTAGGAAAAASRAIAEGAQLILGPLLADNARAVAPIARAAGVPVLSFSNDTSVAGPGTYVMGYVRPSRSRASSIMRMGAASPASRGWCPTASMASAPPPPSCARSRGRAGRSSRSRPMAARPGRSARRRSGWSPRPL